MSKQDKICELFYNKHQKQQDIATAVGVSQQYVSKIIRSDIRYKAEKESRKQCNKQRRKVKQAELVKNRREQQDREYEYLKHLQYCNAKEMSKRYLTNSPQLSKWEKKMYGIKQ